MKLVVEDGRLRRVRLRALPKRAPHIHHGQPNLARTRDAELVVAHRQARLGAIGAAKPDGPSRLEIAHDDAIDVPFPNRDLIDANHGRRWRARHVELRLHVQRVHRFHRMPIEPQILSHFRDRGAAALLADIQREPTRVVRILREPVETLLLHTTARAARHAPQGELQSHLHIAARQIADLSHPVIVPRAADRATDPADRFFFGDDAG